VTRRDDVDRIYLMQDMVQWRAVANTTMNLRYRKRWGTAELLAASQEGLFHGDFRFSQQ
jgi:hypothetical protein